jgi:hypothetical protein
MWISLLKTLFLHEFNEKIYFYIMVCAVHFSVEDPFLFSVPVVNPHPDFSFCYRLAVAALISSDFSSVRFRCAPVRSGLLLEDFAARGAISRLGKTIPRRSCLESGLWLLFIAHQGHHCP